MHATSAPTSTRPISLVVKAALAAFLVATVVTALFITLVTGAAIEHRVIEKGPSQAREVSVHFRAMGWLVDTLWLSPFVAMTLGVFACFAALVAGLIMRRRAVRMRSTKRFVAEASFLGFILGFGFPVFHNLIGPILGVEYYYDRGSIVLAPLFGCLSAFLTALLFRKRFVA